MRSKLRESRRRSHRLPLQVLVQVYGRTPDNRPFRDRTVTLSVSAHGGLLALRARLRRGQTILLVNRLTQEERVCRVVYVGRQRGGKRKIAVEFVNRTGDFWHVYSPLVCASSSPDEGE